MRGKREKTSETRVLAYRRTRKQSANGTGLSHYIFIENGKGRRNR